MTILGEAGMKPGVGRPILASILLLTLAVAGCGSSKQSGTSDEPGSQTKQLTALDLINIIGPEPDTPAGAAYSTDGGSATLTLSDLRGRAQTTQEKATVKAFERAGFQRIFQRSFNGAINVADATAYLFRTAEGAAKGLSVLQETLEKPGGVSQRVTSVPAENLGDDAWAAHVTGGGTEGALFLWRTGTLVVVADMSCDDTCDFDVVEAVRAYVDAIAERAKEIS